MPSINRKTLRQILAAEIGAARVTSTIVEYASRTISVSVPLTTTRVLEKNPLRVYLAFFANPGEAVIVYPLEPNPGTTGFNVEGWVDNPEFYLPTHKGLLQEEWYGFAVTAPRTLFILEQYIKGG